MHRHIGELKVPVRAPSPCSRCRRPSPAGKLCVVCRKKQWKEQDAKRPTARQRGYDGRWQDIRLQVLREEPNCACGCGRPSEVVDHIDGNAKNNQRPNLRAMTKACHDARTARDQAFGRKDGQRTSRATLVCGPPGAGKTTWVRERAKVGDLVVDLDAIHAAISGEAWYDRPSVLLRLAMAARDSLLREFARAPNVRHAWVITSGASNRDRQKVLRLVPGAEVVVLDTSAQECMRRIRADERRSDRWQHWTDIVEKWWERYESVA